MPVGEPFIPRDITVHLGRPEETANKKRCRESELHDWGELCGNCSWKSTGLGSVCCGIGYVCCQAGRNRESKLVGP